VDKEVDWDFSAGQWRYHTGTGEPSVLPIHLAIAIAGIPGKTSSLIRATEQNSCTFKYKRQQATNFEKTSIKDVKESYEGGFTFCKSSI